MLIDPEKRRTHDREQVTPGMESTGTDPRSPLVPPVMPLDVSRPFITPVPFESRTQAVTPDALRAQLPISWWESKRGGTFRVEVSRLDRCGFCGGSGLANPGICSECGGSGRLAATLPVNVDVPPDTPDGAVLNRDVVTPGGEHLWVAVQVRVL